MTDTELKLLGEFYNDELWRCLGNGEKGKRGLGHAPGKLAAIINRWSFRRGTSWAHVPTYASFARGMGINVKKIGILMDYLRQMEMIFIREDPLTRREEWYAPDPRSKHWKVFRAVSIEEFIAAEQSLLLPVQIPLFPPEQLIEQFAEAVNEMVIRAIQQQPVTKMVNAGSESIEPFLAHQFGESNHQKSETSHQNSERIHQIGELPLADSIKKRPPDPGGPCGVKDSKPIEVASSKKHENTREINTLCKCGGTLTYPDTAGEGLVESLKSSGICWKCHTTRQARANGRSLVRSTYSIKERTNVLMETRLKDLLGADASDRLAVWLTRFSKNPGIVEKMVSEAEAQLFREKNPYKPKKPNGWLYSIYWKHGGRE